MPEDQPPCPERVVRSIRHEGSVAQKFLVTKWAGRESGYRFADREAQLPKAQARAIRAAVPVAHHTGFTSLRSGTTKRWVNI